MKLPKSSTSLIINLTGLFCFLFSLYFVSHFFSDWPSNLRLIIVTISLALPIIGLEYIYRRPKLLVTPLAKQAIKPTSNKKRIAVKLCALYTIWSIIAFIYWVFPEYRGSFYQTYWSLLLPSLPGLIVLAIPYFWFVDQRMTNPEDSYYSFGLFLLGKKKFDKPVIIQLFLGWLVKLFFLPLMIVYLSGNINKFDLNTTSWGFITQDFSHLYDHLWILFFTIDLAFVTIGYVLTLRLFDSHIRSTEPTVLGWFSAIICYQPFFGTLSALYLAYNLDSYTWGDWLQNNEIAYVIWGSLILILLLIYALSSVMFGIRFSNLTHRGIITNGPFRFSKHPAYLSKNISWWMISIPFITQSGNFTEVIRACSMLLLMNFIYYVRAKTEERHLMQDPVYQEYALWIDNNGVISKARTLSRKFLSKSSHKL